jgi:hypothetical protein
MLLWVNSKFWLHKIKHLLIKIIGKFDYIKLHKNMINKNKKLHYMLWFLGLMKHISYKSFYVSQGLAWNYNFKIVKDG